MEQNKLTILIVDDEEKTRKVLKINLADTYRILLASNGGEAVKILNQETVHLVLTDLKMPEMNGLELLHHIRDNYKNIPVILMTAYGTAENAVEAMKMGAYDYILKPVKISELELL
ncbi:MAG TPA: response regulator, partial [Caldithrix sp.]|nr:response regulator [Caldithrix sp.]